MPKLIVKTFFIAFAIFAMVSFVIPFFASAISASGPIVTCGRTGQPFCNLCDIPVLIKNLIDYMTFYVALPLAAVMFVVGGYFYLISGGSSQKISQAKTVFLTTLKGLGIVLLSWLFIAEVMVILAGGTTTTAGFRGLGRPWNQLQPSTGCPFGTPSLVTPPVGGGGGQTTCDVNVGGVACVVGGSTGIPCTQPCECDNSCGGGGGGSHCTSDANGNPLCVFSATDIGFFCDVANNTGCGGPTLRCEVDEFTGVPSGVCSQFGQGGTCTGNVDCGGNNPILRCDNTGAPSCISGGIWNGSPGQLCSNNSECQAPSCGDGTCSPFEICAADGCCDPNLLCPALPNSFYSYVGGDSCTTCGWIVRNPPPTFPGALCWCPGWQCHPSSCGGGCGYVGVACQQGPGGP